MSATFDTYRWCPYHGGQIRLADCPIVATNEVYATRLRSRLRASQDRSDLASTGTDDGVLRVDDDLLGGGWQEEPGPGAEPRWRGSVAGLGGGGAGRGGGGPATPVRALTVGSELVSQIDGRARLVLAVPPRRPPRPEGGLLRRPRPMALPSPAVLAADLGGMRARPVRACPDVSCGHPLPMSIDDRDPFVVAIVGNAGATKTTLILALAAQAASGNAPALGLTEFSATEATRRAMRHDLVAYRDGQMTQPTEEGMVFYEPMEFLVGWGPRLPEAVLLVHDLAGENFMDPDLRLAQAAHVLWADAVVFVVNPEETPGMGSMTSDADQSAVLTGVYDDILAGASLRRAAGLDDVPPLLVLLSKADLLGERSLDEADPTESARVVRALERLGADDIILAAQRWPERELRFVAPQPQGGGPTGPTGVLKAFELVFSAMTGGRR